MIKVSDSVRKILFSSEIALTAYYEDYLNLTSYAVSIKNKVEKETKKPVRLGSIVVALSRLKKELRKPKQLIPHVEVESLSVKTGLIELSFNRTEESLAKIPLLYKKNSPAKDYLLISHGVGEISIITLSGVRKFVLDIFREKPKAVIEPLASVTIRLGKDYIHTPNVIYKFIREFAIRSIPIVEVISTYSEISFIVYAKDKDQTIEILSELV